MLKRIPTPNSYALVGRRNLRNNNSWMHNSLRLVKGRPACTLLMNTGDAHAREFSDGQVVVVRSRVGSLEVPLELTAHIAPGVVSLPHGWGHHRKGVRLATAAAHAGVSMNDLTDELRLDALTATAALNGTEVTIERRAPPE